MADVPASPNSTTDLEIVDNKQTELPFADDPEEETVISEIVETVASEGTPSESENEDHSKRNKNSDAKRDDKLLEVFTSSTDKKSIRSRIFVGHLHTSKVSRRDLESFFSKCGKIEAVSLLKGYGFVQFDNEECALKAITKYHGSMFFGSRLVVDKPAAWKRLDGENPNEKKPWPEEEGHSSEGQSRSRSSRRSPDSDRWQTSRDDRRNIGRHSNTGRHRDYDEIPNRYHDPEYERYLELRYMEERLSEKYRLYDPYSSPYPVDYRGTTTRYEYPPSRRYDYAQLPRGYDYPPPTARGEYDYHRDDDYSRERRPFDYYR